MQSDAQGMPKATPTINLEAIVDAICQLGSLISMGQLTDIAPYGSGVIDISIPYDGISEKVEQRDARPEHIEKCSGIPCYPLKFLSAPATTRGDSYTPSKCHGKGIKTRKHAMNDIAEKAWLEAVMSRAH